MTFSDKYVSRASITLGRLAEIDPGGRSIGRPDASLVDLLDLVAPQGAIKVQSRGAVLDPVQARAPSVAWNVTTKPVQNTGGHTVFMASTPQWRDWNEPDTGRPISQVYTDVVTVLDRFTTVVREQPSRAKDLVDLLPQPLRGERQTLLEVIMTAATEVDEKDRNEIAKKLADFASRYRRPQRAARDGIDEDEADAAAQAAETLTPGIFAVPAVDRFSYWPGQ